MALACLLACSESPSGQLSGGGGSEAAPARPKGPAPAPVTIFVVTAEALHDGRTFPGQVEPAHEAALAAAVAGHVVAVTVRIGDRVTKGQRLVTLNDAPLRAQIAIDRAREVGVAAELALAETQLERAQRVRKRHGESQSAISQADMEGFELAVRQQSAARDVIRAEIKRRSVELAQHVIYAPFAGVVSDRRVDPGAWVSGGQSVLDVIATDELEILVDVPAELGGRVVVGERVQVVGSPAVTAEIAGIVNALDRVSRTMRLRLVPLERPTWLLAGRMVDVVFAVSERGGVTIPRDALHTGFAGTEVIKSVDGLAVMVPVEVVVSGKDRVVVRAAPDSAGLQPGDQIVIRGTDRVRSGQPLVPAHEDGDAIAPREPGAAGPSSKQGAADAVSADGAKE